MHDLRHWHGEARAELRKGREWSPLFRLHEIECEEGPLRQRVTGAVRLGHPLPNEALAWLQNIQPERSMLQDPCGEELVLFVLRRLRKVTSATDRMDFIADAGDANIRAVNLFGDDDHVMAIARPFGCNALLAFVAGVIGRPHATARQVWDGAIVLAAERFHDAPPLPAAVTARPS